MKGNEYEESEEKESSMFKLIVQLQKCFLNGLIGMNKRSVERIK